MLNEFVYCPRLAILEWVDGEWAESADTVEGGVRHQAVDRPGFRVRRDRPRDEADPDEPAAERLQLRSIELSDPDLGLVAKLDLIEVSEGRVQPVDYKKGKRPHTATGAWDPERVQICAQGLLLRAHGYACDSGILYFAGSNERVTVPFDDDLVALTRAKLAELRDVAARGVLPPPLEDSPKCPRCSLVSICLPDETRRLAHGGPPPRKLVPASVDTFPVYVHHPGAHVRKNGDVLEIHADDEKLGSARLEEVSSLVLFGRIHPTTPLVHELCRRGIPVIYLSSGGWLQGVLQGLPQRHIALRQHQFAAASDPARCLAIARHIVRAKLLNLRTLLRRNAGDELPEAALNAIRNESRLALRASSMDELLGHEGAGTRVYFENFPLMVKGRPEILEHFSFETRTRRPPRDRMNALLSFAYSMLARELTQVAWSVGLDPYLGYLHAPRYGRPALALDLMEPFRPLVADSACITLVNTGGIRPSDFIERMGAVSLTRESRSKLLMAIERRLAQEVTHPIFGYSVSYRRVFEIEVRLLARHLLGELPVYQPLVTR
jgi:CRISPR-associated endonuclease Cas1/CRISPR-associated protein Cas4